MSWDLRLGDWRSALDGVECDAVITDPPFSERTAVGFRGHNDFTKSGIDYGFITAADIADLLCALRPRWWFVAFTDHVLLPEWEAQLRALEYFTFAPLPWVKRDAPPRFMGDGPASMTEWIVVARPRHRLPKERVGSRPGYYLSRVASENKTASAEIIGRKPLHIMQAIIRDYTIAGDVVVDPFAGTGTTIAAADSIGRHGIGSEVTPATYAYARKRLEGPRQFDLFEAGAAGTASGTTQEGTEMSFAEGNDSGGGGWEQA